MAFVGGVGHGGFVSRVDVRANVCVKKTASVRRHGAQLAMMDDLALARKCAEEGCKLEDVQMVLSRLEVRRKELDKEANEIASLMAQLAKTSIVAAENPNELQKLVESAMRIFSKSEDDFPLRGEPMGYTMDKPKKR